MQPQTCSGPLPLSGSRGNFDCLSRFFDRQSSEETQFYNLALPWVKRRQSSHRVVQCNEIETAFFPRGNVRLIQGDDDLVAAPLCGGRPTRMINQDLSHYLRGHRKEVNTGSRVDGAAANEAQIGLMHQSCRLQCATGALLCQAAAGDA